MRVAIVGATSDIAKCCARQWAARGAEFVLIGRNESDLHALAADLRVRSQGRVDVHALDLSTREGIEASVELGFASGPVDVALLAFGSMPSQAEADADPAVAESLLSLNGSMALLAAHLVVLRLLEVNGGSLVVLGSVAGDRGRQSNYLYGAAKAMVAAGVAGLQHRVAGTNVQVLLVKPGPTATKMTRHLQGDGPKLADPELVAADIVAAVAGGRAMLYTPKRWRYIMAVVRSLPRSIFHRTKL